MVSFELSNQIIIGSSITVIALAVNGFVIWRIKRKAKKPKTVTIKETKYIDRIMDPDGIKKVDLKKDKFYYEAKLHTYFKKKKWYKFNIILTKKWKENRLLKKFPAKIVLVRIEMNNGTHREFLVKDDASGFTFNGGRYVFDLDDRYWVVDSLTWAYDFHESLSISLKNIVKPNPDLVKLVDDLEQESKKGIKKRIPVNDIKETIEQSGVTEVENSLNPIVLERVIKSEIIQAILQGSALGRLFRVILILIIIILIVVAVDTLIDFSASELPQQLGIGGDGE